MARITEKERPLRASGAIERETVMEISKECLTAEKWQAITRNDASYDGRFFYAVVTTGIFCRPSCQSKPPNKENVRLFQNAEQALSANYRPCKRCKPTARRLPDDEWVAQIMQTIDLNSNKPLTLNTLAELCHGSPYHLQRTFKRIRGITPAAYVQRVRINKAKSYLMHSDIAIADVALAVGIPNTSYFVTLFKQKTGCTPANYRQLNCLQPAAEVLSSGSKN